MNPPRQLDPDEEFAECWDDFIANVVRKVVPGQYDLAFGLGTIELELRRRERALPLMLDLKVVTHRHRQHAYEHEILCVYSALWALGAYELTRVLEERLNPDRRVSPPFPEALKLKRLFERVRMPLAKLQKSEASFRTD